MKKIFLFKIMLLLLFNNIYSQKIYSQKLDLVGTKEIFDIDFSKAKQLKFQFSNGKIIGSYLGISIIEEIDKLLKENSIEPTETNLLIAFENNKSIKYYTYFDFSNEIVAISPYLITQQKVKYKMSDTIQYNTKSGKQTSNMDFTELEEQIFSVVITNVKLQFKSMPATEKNNIFNKSSLIFPVDKTSNRWLSDVKRFKIYKIKK